MAVLGERADTRNFNPRSPHGERHFRHALQADQRYFNPRSPHGERLIFLHLRTVNNYFNPRSPHGERPDRANSRARPGENFNPRSPHGERHERGGGMAKRPPFQSTLPARGATIVASKADCTIRISIHAPRTGSDCKICNLLKHLIISIHAPRTGSDAAWRMQSGSLLIFQSTLPARGATGRLRQHVGIERNFNPRSPHGERLEITAVLFCFTSISIHAPRTGSDAIER